MIKKYLGPITFVLSFTVSIALGLSSTSGFAAELFTAPLNVYSAPDGSGTGFYCNIVNVSPKTLTVEISVEGNTYHSEGEPFDLSPGDVESVGIGNYPGLYYCKFKVKGNKESV